MEDKIQDGEVIEDSRTGEIIPAGVSKSVVTQNSSVQIQVNVNTIGTLELDEKAQSVLDEKLNPEDVKIRPDGLVYLPWTYWAGKLNEAFGRLKWGLIPQGAPQSKDTGNNNVLVVWGFWLCVKGVPISFSMGETSYKTNNATMSYADAIEGAKSSSLARSCKQLGMALEMWDSVWVNDWKKRYAEQYEGNNGKTLWRKKLAKVAKPVQKPTSDGIVENLGNENIDNKPPMSEVQRVSGQQELEDVDKAFPPDGATAEAQKLATEGEQAYTFKQFTKETHLVKEVAQATGKKDSEVVMFAKNFGEKFTVSQIVSGLSATVEQTGE